ncbi:MULTISPECIES: restriction endonuclease subunit M [Francisella]|uniref:Restriction endonuclease subunit M n=1 Tax=Francisella opportunistica TaxID=2016517 RepID=A0A345JQL5_9GAMM|nr:MULTISPECIES: N-6 DNA methylase [Francisella]APC91316.1 Type I restriction-modification system, DNA-methyltransferase subunit M / Type I restriction-modification system, specificity subunit S [Francisella sp. MA067296]AXH29611.1 restriction endonuclease subunit M [Francisella opportunistica]AXH31262.1 N-6 DNA methylase [Francisella opportunistica]AXH32909.1 N-6 DNA methylase [Francisella opportunistica]
MSNDLEVKHQKTKFDILKEEIKYLQQGIEDNHIRLDDEYRRITYVFQDRSRNIDNPEERIQADTFLKLVYDYDYSPEYINQFEVITDGSTKKEVDMVVYDDKAHEKPKLIVECKKQEVSESEYRQAVNQAFSYARFISRTIKYIWVTSGILNDYFRFDKDKNLKETLPDIPKFGEDRVPPFKYAKGEVCKDAKYKAYKDKKFKDIQTVSEGELTRIFKQAHNALWAGGQLNPSEAFDELDKLIFCKIWDERYNLEGNNKKARKKGEVYHFQVIQEDLLKEDIEKGRAEDYRTNKALAERVRYIYNRGKEFDKEVFKDDIRLSDSRIRTIVNYLQGVNLNKTDLDSKGRAFETFMGSFFRGDFGQYFTPRPIVKFVVDVLNIKNTDRVLDTSCGSGGFLLHALDKVRKQADQEYPDFETDINDAKYHHNYWHDFAEKNLFGIEINEQIARTAKMNMIIHDDGHTNVIASDGLVSFDEMQKTNKEFKANSMDFIITNPPFGSKVKKSEKNYLKTFDFGNTEIDWLDLKTKKSKEKDSQSTEVLFIEQCYKFLKENGFVAIVIPDGILTNSSLQYVRDQIEDWFRLVAVVSMPQTAFAANGAGVKSSVLFLRKWPIEKSQAYKQLKVDLQNNIKDSQNYENTCKAIEAEKKEVIKNHTGFINTTAETDKKAIEKTSEFKDWKTEISAEYNQKLADFKEKLTDLYQEQRKEQIKSQNLDYPIFMAIAENIGYDATGKETGNNELDEIQQHLTKFIKDIEDGRI